MNTNAHRRILIAPLDWGLGHTTRCIPIMRYLLSRGHLVSFAGNEWQRRYINESFKGIETIHLDGYNVTYSRHGSGFMFSLFNQVPGLLRTIRREHEWLDNIVKQQKYDAVISDNRYGLFHKDLHCVMMTHQLLAQTGMGSAADSLLRRLHYKYIHRFNRCWIVDVPGVPNLSGKLAHPSVIPSNATYIGLLSQVGEDVVAVDQKHLLILLSGPEPQRTILASLLWQQVHQYQDKVIFVEGSHQAQRPSLVPGHIEWHAQITKETLQPLLQNAKLVICRSGYSTLMDLVALRKAAVIIPTPGQTEQVYLGRHLHKEGVFYCASQKNFNLLETLESTRQFPFRQLSLEHSGTIYQGIVDQWLTEL